MTENNQMLGRYPYASLLDGAKTCAPVTVAIVHPVSNESIEAAVDAKAEGLIEPVLVGPRARILEAAEGVDITGWELIDTEHSHAAAAKAVELAARGKVDALMKGRHI